MFTELSEVSPTPGIKGNRAHSCAESSIERVVMDKKIKRQKVVRVAESSGETNSTWFAQGICTREKCKRAGSRRYFDFKFHAPSLEAARVIALNLVVLGIDRADLEQVTLFQMVNDKLTQMDSVHVMQPRPEGQSATQPPAQLFRLLHIPNFPKEARLRLRSLGVICD
jgi:hypothetical protein